MPPRLPHGLKKNPIHMNVGEKAMFAVLGASVFAGLMNLATSPLYSSKEEEGKQSTDDAADKKKKIYPFAV